MEDHPKKLLGAKKKLIIKDKDPKTPAALAVAAAAAAKKIVKAPKAASGGVGGVGGVGGGVQEAVAFISSQQEAQEAEEVVEQDGGKGWKGRKSGKKGKGGKSKGKGKGGDKKKGGKVSITDMSTDRTCDAITVWTKDTRDDTKPEVRAEMAEKAIKWYKGLRDSCNLRALEALLKDARAARVSPLVHLAVSHIVDSLKSVNDFYLGRVKAVYDESLDELKKKTSMFYGVDGVYNRPLNVDMANEENRNRIRMELPQLFMENKLKYGTTTLVAEHMGMLVGAARRDVEKFIEGREDATGLKADAQVEVMPNKVSYLTSDDKFALRFAIDPEANAIGIPSAVVVFRIGSSDQYRVDKVLSTVDYDTTLASTEITLAEEYDPKQMYEILHVHGSLRSFEAPRSSAYSGIRKSRDSRDSSSTKTKRSKRQSSSRSSNY